MLLLYNADFALVAQDTMGLIEFLSSTKQIRQFPAIDNHYDNNSVVLRFR
jgi:hypothetical protein